MPNTELLTKLRIKGSPKQTKDGIKYRCFCPCHTDKTASLDVTIKPDETILINDFGGCDTKDILKALDLNPSEVFKKNTNRESSWKNYLEGKYKRQIETVYHYRDIKGGYLYSKIRFERNEEGEKAFIFGEIDFSNDRITEGRSKSPTLYNLEELEKQIEKGYPVFIVEGEKDVETLKQNGFIGTTPGGANDWKKQYSNYFIGAKVIILYDNDKPGEKFKEQIIKDLKESAFKIQWSLTSTAPHGDISDYFAEGHTKEEFKALINSIPAESTLYAKWVKITQEGRIIINSDRLAACIKDNTDYLIMRNIADNRDLIYLYDNGVYKQVNANGLKARIKKYIPLGLATNQKIQETFYLMLYTDNIKELNDLDTEENYINLKNGLYNINTGQLEQHKSTIYNTVQLNCEYKEDDNFCPVFTRYINELCMDEEGNINESKKAIIQEYGGLLLSNINISRIKKALVLYSGIGNTGKSQLIALFIHFLGVDKVTTMQLQEMNEKSKFSIGSVIGKRLISIGDNSGAEIKEESVFKELTGGDIIKAEQKNKQPFAYFYKGGIVMACNNIPAFANDKGQHIFDRLQIIPCNHVIPPEKRDPDILNKMIPESSAIFNWFLEGLNRLIDNDYMFTPSEECENCKREYRTNLDTVFNFIAKNYTVTGKKSDLILKTVLEDEYITFCRSNCLNPVKKQELKRRMESNGIICRQARPIIEGQCKPGNTCYIGLIKKDLKEL